MEYMKIDGIIESISEGYHTYFDNLVDALIKRIIACVGACFGYTDENTDETIEPTLYTKTHGHIIQKELVDDKTTHFWMDNCCCTIETGPKMVATLPNQHIENDLLFSCAEVIGTLFSQSTAQQLEIKMFKDTHYNAMTNQGLGKYDPAAVHTQRFTLTVTKAAVPVFDRIGSY